MNALYQMLNGGNPTKNIMSQLSQLRANPIQFLMNRRMNVPQELSGNPQGIIQHLLNTGQMSQDTFNKLQKQVNQMMK